MPMYQRITGAAGLLVLGGFATWFLGVQVTRCLGRIGGRTMVEAIRDGCIEPSVGPGMPIFAVALVAALLLLMPVRRESASAKLVGAAVGAVVAAVVYLVVRPTSLTGPTSTGDVITVALQFDWWALWAAGIAGAGVGWLLGSWRSRPGRSRSALSRSA